MDCPRLVRSLRNAWTAVFGILSVLLIARWERSFRAQDILRRCNGATLLIIESYRGEIGVGRWAFRKPIPWQWFAETMVTFDESSKRLWPPMKDVAPLSYIGIRWQTIWPLHLFAIKYWSAVVLSAAFIILPWLSWLRWRFSLRTLLIATTLIAVGLGLAVWATR
jgi:hypothetical protein